MARVVFQFITPPTPPFLEHKSFQAFLHTVETQHTTLINKLFEQSPWLTKKILLLLLSIMDPECVKVSFCKETKEIFNLKRLLRSRERGKDTLGYGIVRLSPESKETKKNRGPFPNLSPSPSQTNSQELVQHQVCNWQSIKFKTRSKNDTITFFKNVFTTTVHAHSNLLPLQLDSLEMMLLVPFSLPLSDVHVNQVLW